MGSSFPWRESFLADKSNLTRVRLQKGLYIVKRGSRGYTVVVRN